MGSGGTTTLTVEPGALVMLAPDDTDTLDRVTDVTGRHLERSGEKGGLVVTLQESRVQRLVRHG